MCRVISTKYLQNLYYPYFPMVIWILWRLHTLYVFVLSAESTLKRNRVKGVRLGENRLVAKKFCRYPEEPMSHIIHYPLSPSPSNTCSVTFYFIFFFLERMFNNSRRYPSMSTIGRPLSNETDRTTPKPIPQIQVRLFILFKPLNSRVINSSSYWNKKKKINKNFRTT